MNTYRKNTTIAGLLYITATVAGFLSLGLSEPVRDAQNVLASVVANANDVKIASLLVMLMALSLAMVPIVLYPILRRHNEVLAIGYVVFRGALETIVGLLTPAMWLLLLSLGKLYAQAGDSAATAFQAQGAHLQKAGELSGLLGIVFCLGALMFYTVLYQSRLVPRWLSVWGLMAVVPYLAAEALGLFGLVDPLSTTAVLMHIPLALQEMVLAVWLIVKGFNPAALAAQPVQVAGVGRGR